MKTRLISIESQPKKIVVVVVVIGVVVVVVHLHVVVVVVHVVVVVIPVVDPRNQSCKKIVFVRYPDFQWKNVRIMHLVNFVIV